MAGGGDVKTSSKMNKPRVGVLFRQVAAGQKPTHTPSEQVETLTHKYKDMCQHLKRLQKVFKERHVAMLETIQAQDAMANAFATLSKDTPLSELIGTSPTSTEDNTYAHAVDTWTKKSRIRADEFQKIAMDYVAQWEKILTTRVNAEMKQTEQLRRDADHYKTKVDSLVTSTEKLEQKNKPIPGSTKEKLQRNREKSEEATLKYNESVDELYILLDEVVNRSWRDLHPLLIQLLKWDVNKTKNSDHDDDNDAVLKEMRNVGSALVDLARAEEIKPRYKPTWTWSHVGSSFFEENPPSF